MKYNYIPEKTGPYNEIEFNRRLADVCHLVAVKPITVTILNKEKQISADRRYEVECKTTGSRPEAHVTWWKSNRQLKRMAKNVSKMLVKFVELSPSV